GTAPRPPLARRPGLRHRSPAGPRPGAARRRELREPAERRPGERGGRAVRARGMRTIESWRPPQPDLVPAHRVFPTARRHPANAVGYSASAATASNRAHPPRLVTEDIVARAPGRPRIPRWARRPLLDRARVRVRRRPPTRPPSIH